MNKRMYECQVIADSQSPDGHRITTVQVIYPHAVHKDLLRHRAFNHSVESFRAQKPEDLIDNLRDGHAFMPEVFAKRIKGMGQSEEQIIDHGAAAGMWIRHMQNATDIAREFLKMDIAKQQVNFLIQDFCPLVDIITATDWSNFFALRLETNDDGTPVARPEIYKTAYAISLAMAKSNPVKLDYGQIHLPFVTDGELAELSNAPEAYWVGVSAGRAARNSYGAYQWWKEQPEDSYARSQKLLSKGHMSPFEHQAKPFSIARLSIIRDLQQAIEDSLDPAGFGGLSATEVREMERQLEYSGNMHGWVPARKTIPNEYDYSLIPK